ncbi:MAG: glycine/sarcosine/betaine reductase component B subunit [Cloacibacillus sp.]
MRLEIGKFNVKDIVFDHRTSFSDGQLSINKEEALAVILKDTHITYADLKIVHPGDMVRLVPVKDSVEFRCKVDGGEGAYPGVTSPLGQAGKGKTHVLSGTSLIAVGRHWGGFQDGLIDMGGQYQHYTIWGDMVNLVMIADTDEIEEQREQQKKNHAIRWAALRLAEYIAQSVRDLTPEEVDVYELPPVTDRSEDIKNLPGVVYILQCQTQMEAQGYNTLVYGWDGNRMLPTYLHPNEILDGAMVSGSFMPSSSKISTYEYSTSPTIKALYNAHGKTINFLGVILSTLNPKMEEKERCVMMAAKLALSIGATGAIVAEEGYGNPDVDYTAMLVELERFGIKTVGLSDEATGRDGASQPLVSMNPATTALVTTGNVSEFYRLAPMEVIGELDALARDGNSGGWEGCIDADGGCVIENNGMFCANHISGYSKRSCTDF